MAPISVKGVTMLSCPCPREVDQALRHRYIQRARGVGVDDRVGVDGVQERLLVHAPRNPQHLEVIKRLRRATGEEERELVGQATCVRVVK
jgi:hypothetical protein